MSAMNSRLGPMALLIGLAAGAALCGGCGNQAASAPSNSMTSRQDQAIRDPFGYTPDLKNSDMSVSGHGTFDKEGFDRDKDFVLNP